MELQLTRSEIREGQKIPAVKKGWKYMARQAFSMDNGDRYQKGTVVEVMRVTSTAVFMKVPGALETFKTTFSGGHRYLWQLVEERT